MVAEQVRADLSKSYNIDIEPLKTALILKNKRVVKSSGKAKGDKSVQSDDYERGLRDWELRNA
jgi:hypothetical protein